MTRLKSLLSKVAILTLVLGLFATALPVNAAVPTSMKDTLTRLKISTSADHALTVTLTDTVDSSETVTFNYSTPSFALVDSTPSCTLGTGTCTAAVVASTDIVTVTCTASGGCNGLLTIGTFTGTNPGTAGSKTIVLGGSGGVTGSFAISIADDDQVTVTATVDPSITFDLDTATTDTGSDAPYTVALGTITTDDTRVSGATDGVNFIWVDLDTNASGGAVVTVLSTNGASGLVSTSVSGDDIDNTAGTVADNTENYGLCVVDATQTSGNLDEEGNYDADTCAADSETNAVASLATVGNIFDTDGDPVAGGRGQIAVGASITGIQPAHSDYTDTLTFIATGTF